MPLWIDAAEPAYRSRLWLGRSPACTHPSPTGKKKLKTHPDGTGTNVTHTNIFKLTNNLMGILLMTVVKLSFLKLVK